MAEFNSIGRTGQPLRPERIEGTPQAPQSSRQAEPGTAPTQPLRDEVTLSEAVQEKASGESFDASRVAEIRSAIERGSYPLDARRIAESFIALEQLISSSPSPGSADRN